MITTENEVAIEVQTVLSMAERLEIAYQLDPISGLTLMLEDYSEEEVELSNFEANPQGKGIGTAGMDRLVSLADKMRINLMLIVAGRPGSRKHERLERFYQRFGFEISSSNDIMRREFNKGGRFGN